MTAKKKARKSRKPVNLFQIACYVTPEQRDALRALSARTRVAQQVHLREAIDDLLAKYKQTKGTPSAQR
jgi:hypothetical protein